MPAGPRIYNMFPLLAGTVQEWIDHLDRIAKMRFNWVFVNSFHYPGFSGSIYAVKDPSRLHPLMQGNAPSPDEALSAFVQAAAAKKLAVMMDLEINHTAKDALLVNKQPAWFKRTLDGGLASPRAVNPLDPRCFTVWGDLAEIDYGDPSRHEAQVAYWVRHVRHFLKLGFKGFRCDSAYKVPAAIWQAIIAKAKATSPDCIFVAETLGCTETEVLALGDAGFDYLMSSSKWWDFRSPWLLEQYNRFRPIAPSIGFPESHDTQRLAIELGDPEPVDLERHYRFRYAFAAAFSTGVLMPMGYEYGCRRHLDVVETRSGGWTFETTTPRIDLVDAITAINTMKANVPALNVEGPQCLVTAPHSVIVGLLRLSDGDLISSNEASVVLINPSADALQGIDPGPILNRAAGSIDRFEDVTPDAAPVAFEPGEPVLLPPLSMRIFRGRSSQRRGRLAPAAARNRNQERAGMQRLELLAASRVVIERVLPELDGGRHAIKRVVGDVVEVSADIFGDGHDQIAACIQYRPIDERSWREAAMRFVDNDRWTGRFPVQRNIRYRYRIAAWRDPFASWRAEVMKKHTAGLDLSLELEEGRLLLEQARDQQKGADRKALDDILTTLLGLFDNEGDRLHHLLGPDLAQRMARCGIRSNLSYYRHELDVFVDRPAASFGAWYEMFPRSQADDPKRHGTFQDVIKKLPYVRDLGFDVLYFTPIHPIGKTNKKGRNNAIHAQLDDPGSPYAIGSDAGGHDALHPELGSFDDFHALIEAAHVHGLEIALDFAINCSPDHPWIKEHPAWFDWRPDGTIKYAENPPKKYEDIVNVHFYGEALPDVWLALRDVILFWVGHGVKIFRVDNPHTKPVPFWEWLIREVQDRNPETIFLSEAFTRPKMMKQLAKIGFTQSYSYFTWRNTKSELTDYLIELTTSESCEYMRPNFFANTPDINPYYLQTSGRAGFMIRLVLAGTLAPVYGIYNGYELCEGRAILGKEEYLDSEKYEIKAWDYDRPGNIRDYIARFNRIRRENPALHEFTNLTFYNAWNDQVLVYGKMTRAKDNIILVAVSLDPHHPQEAHFEVPLWELGLPDWGEVQVEDLFGGHHFVWHGKVQHVWLDPATSPCAIWRITPPGFRA